MVKVTSLLIKAGSGLGFNFGVRAWTEMEIWCFKGMYMLKVVSSEKNLGFRDKLMNRYARRSVRLAYCALQVGCHKETESAHLVAYQVNQLSLGLHRLQKTLINHKMTAALSL